MLRLASVSSFCFLGVRGLSASCKVGTCFLDNVIHARLSYPVLQLPFILLLQILSDFFLNWRPTFPPLRR
ncbi:hypothetical protein K2173_005382 [Erythroxylum novogranatense]|uniref:Secreted protein n=1 Tax=Erythroxylum novogranatense TaxID=1862640 RepID=A0AAV8TBE5_9ROSI|nr:hypothetical protein K2173_005382 [Erythroxylum novogranatense]